MRENEVEKYLLTRIKTMGGRVIKLNSSSMRGLPDRMILLPKGRIYFVELKAPGKTPRPLQAAVIKSMIDMGFEVLVIDTKEKVGEFINGIQTSSIPTDSDR